MMRTAAEMAKWDAQLVSVAGVQMTNAEAQAARRRVLENGDHYTKLAHERGLIRSGQEDDLLRTVRQIHDLSEQERDGTITADRKAHLEALRGSSIGQAAEQVTAQALSLAKSPSDSQVLDLSALSRRRSRFDDHHADSPAPTPALPLWRRSPARP